MIFARDNAYRKKNWGERVASKMLFFFVTYLRDLTADPKKKICSIFT